MRMERVEYGGWPDCIRIANDTVEVVVTTAVGPRILRYGFVGGENELFEDPAHAGRTCAREWLAFGGHRLWIAPEQMPRSYPADSVPVAYTLEDDTLRLVTEVEGVSGFHKEIDVTLAAAGSRLTVRHRIVNRGRWPVEAAPWALTVLRPGGRAILPGEPHHRHPGECDWTKEDGLQRYFLPVRTVALWSYTDLSDRRYRFTGKYLVIRQDPAASSPQKIGLSNRAGWGAYLRGGSLFVKRCDFVEGAVYPDGGCSFECFTNADIFELETLGPLATVRPGAALSHVEDWFLFGSGGVEDTDESIDAHVLAKVEPYLVG